MVQRINLPILLLLLSCCEFDLLEEQVEVSKKMLGMMRKNEVEKLDCLGSEVGKRIVEKLEVVQL